MEADARNRRLGPLVQHPPPPPRPGRHHATTSRKPTHSNVKGSGLNKPPQNPGLDKQREGRCTRYGARHPLRGATPDQKGCNAYRSGAPPPTTSTTAGNSPPQTPTAHLRRCDTASTCSPGSEREALHPLRRATPVTSQCTRSEGVQCLQIGCTASHNKPNRGHFLPTHPSGCIRRSHTTSKYPPGSEREALHPLRRNAPVTSRYTRYVAMHPIRRGAMPTDRVHRLIDIKLARRLPR